MKSPTKLRQVIKISQDLEIILTKGACGYEDVLQDFEIASIIRVVTYNISTQTKGRLDFVKNLNGKKDIKIITNIPGRFPEYYRSSAKINANKNIIDYMKNMSPENFNGDESSFFNFQNHSKIVATENLAYIGSANFSDPSDQNIECGILIRDKGIINQIINDFIAEIEKDSITYFGQESEELLILVQHIHDQLSIEISTQKELIINQYLTAKEGDVYYDPKIDKFQTDRIEELLSVALQIEDLQQTTEFKKLVKSIDNNYSFDRVHQIIEKISPESSIHDFAIFDFDNYVNNYLSENSLEIVEETIEEYSQSAIEQASNKQTNLIELCEEEFIDLFDLVEQESAFLKNVIDYLKPIISQHGKINNAL